MEGVASRSRARPLAVQGPYTHAHLCRPRGLVLSGMGLTWCVAMCMEKASAARDDRLPQACWSCHLSSPAASQTALSAAPVSVQPRLPGAATFTVHVHTDFCQFHALSVLEAGTQVRLSVQLCKNVTYE